MRAQYVGSSTATYRRMGLPALFLCAMGSISSTDGAYQAPRRLAEEPNPATCSEKLGGRHITIRDDAVQTSVDTIGSGFDGFTTYQIKLHLGANVDSVYSIFGTQDRQLIFPPAYQCPQPFGVDVGGVSSAFFEVANSDATGFARYDSWLTVGITDGDGSNSLSSLGIDFARWDVDQVLMSDIGTGGAVFWMGALDAATGVSSDRTVVIAQLTLRDSALGDGRSETAHFSTRA